MDLRLTSGKLGGMYCKKVVYKQVVSLTFCMANKMSPWSSEWKIKTTGFEINHKKMIKLQSWK